MAYAHEVAIDLVVLGEQRKDIDIADLRTHDHRLARVVVQRVEPLLAALRRLEAQLGRRACHLRFEVGAHRTQVAPQHRHHQPDRLRILLLALRPDAGTLAVPQVVLQTHRVTAPGDGLGREVELARTQRHHLADEFEHAALHADRRIGPEILRAVAQQLARGLHAGEGLAPHDDPGIGLVVLEQDVVARLEGFDERILKQQGVRLAVHHDVAYGRDLAHHHPHLGRMVLVFEEVGAHPLAEALGLAHVDDLSRAVEKLVYARRERQQRRLLARRERGMFVRFGHRGKISNYSAKSPARTAESRPGAPGKRHARRQNTQHGVFQI